MIKKILTVMTALMLCACGSSVKVSKEFTYDKKKPSQQTYKRDNSLPGTLTAKQQNEIVMLSFSLLNTRYNWGGKRPDFGLDCSGLVSYVYKKSIGVDLSGAARHIVNKGRDIPLSYQRAGKLQPGDLIFFNTTGKSYSHVGIYVGENKFLHASSGKKKVITSSLDNPYYKKRMERIKRI